MQQQHAFQLKVQEYTLHFAEELLRLFDMRACTQAWLKQQQQGLQRFIRQLDDQASDDGIERMVQHIEVLSHMATATYLNHQQQSSLAACLKATQISLQALPFADLEDALSQASWGGDTEIHALRCEWLNRLTTLKCKASQQVLSLPKKQQSIEHLPWQHHPHWQTLQSYQQLGDPDKTPMQLILLLTQLESLLQVDGLLS